MSGTAIQVVEIPIITIYVRHSQDCKNKNDETYKRCNCPKHVRWFRSGKLYRKAAKTRSWSQAEHVRDSLRQQFESAVKGEPSPETKQLKMIDEGITLFLKDKKIQGVSDGVYKKYKRELERLKTFCEREGVFAVNHITGELLISFCGTWDSIYHSTTTCDRVRQRLRSFLRFCYESRWMDRIPRTPKFKVAESETLPLTKEEYKKLLAVIPTTVTTAITQRRTHALFQLMRHSGLSILDATTLPRNQMIYDTVKGIYKIITSRHKNENHVYVPIPTNIAEELLSIPNDNKLYFFWSGSGSGLGIAHSFQKNYIRPCFKAAGLYDDGYMKSHRLRDTFAVDLLEKGVPLEEVSKLLGHKSIKTTENHYAKWVKSRQDRLDTLVVATWEKQ